jgi:hypothetical protein
MGLVKNGVFYLSLDIFQRNFAHLLAGHEKNGTEKIVA